jgi:hypothetical protein
MGNLLFLPFILVVLSGVLWLQWRLSKAKTVWPGLVLPIITLFIAVVDTIASVVRDYASSLVQPWTITVNALIVFLISIIPTIALMGIYLHQHGKTRHHEELDTMSIQDL